MKANLFTRSAAALLAVAAVATFSTRSEAFFFFPPPYHHHHHHFKHVKTVKFSPAQPDPSHHTPLWAQYFAGVGICSTASLGLELALAGGKPLSYSTAHGAVAGCFVPFLGKWLLVDYYKRMCTLSRTNPAYRQYSIYCS